jgi:hypothetical protein
MFDNTNRLGDVTCDDDSAVSLEFGASDKMCECVYVCMYVWNGGMNDNAG